MFLSLESGRVGDAVVVQCCGDITADNSGEIEKFIKNLVSQGEKKIVMDLSGAEMITSSGWGVFVMFSNRMNTKQGYFRLAAMNPEGVEVFKLLNLDIIMKIYSSVDDAAACS